nr:WbuC family cupin fold metalloprotein [uncultured Holophaga sp.]
MAAITPEVLTCLIQEARQSPRLRRNLNLHQGNEARCHRLLNAVEPGSYIRPHRHLDPEKGESVALVAGRLGVLIFDETGGVSELIPMDRAGGSLVVDLVPGTYHAMVALEPGSVFFEAKAGPYLPLGADEIAPWAPAEGTPEAAVYLEGMVARFR